MNVQFNSKLKLSILVSFFLLTVVSFGQQEVSLMTYNLLNFSSNNSAEKQNAVATVINHVNPDILVAQELSGDDPHLVLYSHLNQNEYGVGDYIKGYNSNKAIYYKKSKFSFISNIAINTNLRDINEFKLLSLYTGDTIRIYGVHLQASSGSDNEKNRHEEVKLLRAVTDQLTQGSIYFVCGDFNIYKSYEAGYQELLDQTKSGYFVDPITMVGSFGQPEYASFHTQSSRKEGFGGGGMDDRFDMILHSPSVEEGTKVSYVSTTVIGNDGNHYDRAVNDLPNNSAPSNVIQALFDGSDHLPAIATYSFKKPTSDTTSSSSNSNNNQLIITEFATEGSAEWVEIYNASDKMLNLSDYYITQFTGSGPGFSTKYNLDPNSTGTTINAGSYAVVIDNGDLESDFTSRWTDFPFSSAIVVTSLSLSNGTTGDEIIIASESNDSIVDQVNWSNSSELKAFSDGSLPSSSSSETASRNTLSGISDNTINWSLCNGTPGKTNDCNKVVPNQKPIANDFITGSIENVLEPIIVLPVNGSDAENDALEIKIVSQPTNGIAIVNGNKIDYTATAKGTYSIGYKICEAATADNFCSNTQYISVNVSSAPSTNLPLAGDLIITEFASEGTADWVEVYNSTDKTLNLSNYAITQYSGSGPSLSTKYNLDPNSSQTTIAPGEYKVIIESWDSESSFTTRWPSFPFSNAIVISNLLISSFSDEIIIAASINDSIIDMVSWASSNDLANFTGGSSPTYNSGETTARNTFEGVSNDTVNWSLASTGTPGAINIFNNNTDTANTNPVISEKGYLIISEFSSEGFEDWVEIYNASDKVLNLADYAITQYSGSGPSLSIKYNLDPNSTGTTIGPGEFKVIIESNDLESSFKSRWVDFPFSSSIVVNSLVLLSSSDEIIISKATSDSIIDMIAWKDGNELKAFSSGVLPGLNSSETAVRTNFAGSSSNPSNWFLSSIATPGRANSITTNTSEDSAEGLLNYFYIYPNPSNGRVFLKLNSNKTLNIKIYNLLGGLVVSQQINNYSELNLNPGFYTVNLFRDSEFITSRKLIVN